MNSNYTIAFFHPKTGKPVFLATTADINKICYEKYPQIPGTFDIAKAKIYKDLDEAKNVIFKLRYHHREFLAVLSIIKRIDAYTSIDTDDIYTYDLNDFYIESI